MGFLATRAQPGDAACQTVQSGSLHRGGIGFDRACHRDGGASCISCDTRGAMVLQQMKAACHRQRLRASRASPYS